MLATQLRSRITLGESITPRVEYCFAFSLTSSCSHYIENTSDTEDLVWIEIYKSDRVVDIPLTQWLALTPADIVAQTLKVPISIVEQMKKEKQVLIA